MDESGNEEDENELKHEERGWEIQGVFMEPYALPSVLVSLLAHDCLVSHFQESVNHS